jgi:hypothetical protein
MKIVGQRLRDHIRLLTPMFILLTTIWFLRLMSAAFNLPAWWLRIFSVTVATSLSVMLAVLLIHVRRFGGYTNVVLSSLLIHVWASGLIILAIVFSVLTRTENVFNRPEYSLGVDDPLHLRHIYGHLTFGIGWGTLSGSAVGCLLLWLLRLLMPLPHQKTEIR